jgi:Zn finger protein HypA/HybF involved in hydrogenase expression
MLAAVVTCFDYGILILLFQGLSLPCGVLVAYFICMRQWKRLVAIQKHAGASAARGAFHEAMRGLPAFQPLNCAKCGAGLLLEPDALRCPSCGHQCSVPEDYRAALALKQNLQRLLRSAQGAWRFAWGLTSRPARVLLVLLIGAQVLALVPLAMLDFDRRPDTAVFRFLATLPEGPLFFIGVLGEASWLIGLCLLIDLSKRLRRGLPAFPKLGQAVKVSETASCQSCGGAVQYDRGDFATICPYCHVENYRVQSTRIERGHSEKQQARVEFTLFGALNIVNEFLWTTWIWGAMAVAAALIIAGKIMLWNRLGWG